MKSCFSITLLSLLFPLVLFSQEYGYTHYDSKDGLAGSTVYCMTQDKDGFMWFGTESGLSRFDGTHFKNFTQEDGLPDNEIIQLFADSKGRVWIAPFKKAICYYYKGKIYNEQSDTILKQIHVGDNIVHIAEDAQGNILLQEVSRLHLVTANRKVSSIFKIGNDSITYCSIVAPNAKGGFWVIEKNRLFEFNNNRFTLNDIINFKKPHFAFVAMSDKILAWESDFQIHVKSFVPRKKVSFPPVFKFTIFSIVDTSHIGVNSVAGTTIYNLNTTDSIEHFLNEVSTSGVFKDTEGNTWFTTLGQGIYRLNSASVFNVKIKNRNTFGQAISFAPYEKSLLIGSDKNILYQLITDKQKTEVKELTVPTEFRNPVLVLYIHKGKTIFYGSSYGIFKFSPQNRTVHVIRVISVKSFFPYKNNLLVATNKTVIVVNPETFKITDTIWRERATTVFATNDTIYIGTLNGLYCLFPDKSVKYLGEENEVFRKRITSITKDTNNVLWIATLGAGVIAYKNHIILQINQKSGLTSDICRTLFLYNNSLWVGTNKGLNKIDISRPHDPIKKYTTGDGLRSDIINTVYVEGSKVFVGTPEGVTFFDEQKINSESRCDLTFTDVEVGDQTFDPTDMPALIPHEKNNIQFSYVGISYKSAGDIRYRYRLLGLDSNWKETRQTFLSYPTLPSGDYQLQVQAINKFDVLSKVITASFTIEKLTWEKTWFRLLMGFVFLAFTALLVWFIIHRIQKREQERTAISKRIGELEQLARKAQMNPHFIFNSLNSIQQYVMDADITGANKFISGFSRLIRQTLDFSSKSDISLEQELDYLSNYLELERTRLENAFSWSVTVAKDVHPADYFIPPMILQPFIENSVRHGLRFRRDKEGKVSINIKKENDYLICILEDNGIGRKAALQFKSVNAIEYQSKGMSLTAERIAMLNKDNSEKITMQIDDLEDDQQKPLGTRVTISFPVS